MKKRKMAATCILCVALGLGLFTQAVQGMDLLGDLVGGLVDGFLGSESETNTHFGTYRDAEKYKAGDFTYKSDEVSKVKVYWVSGDIWVSQGAGELSVSEEEQEKEEKKLHYLLNQDTLTIQFCSSNYKGKPWSKDLSLEIPEGVALEISTVSGSTEMGEVSLASLDYKGVSSPLEIEKAFIEGNLSVDTVSGDVEIESLSAESLTIQSVSGESKLGLSSLKKARLESVSGDMELTLLDGMGAKVSYEGLSGKNKDTTYGDGKASIQAESVSGKLKVMEK